LKKIRVSLFSLPALGVILQWMAGNKVTLNYTTMTRITKLQNEIVKRHLEAKANNKFSDPPVSTLESVKEALLKGETIRFLYEEIEIRHCSIGAIILSNPGTFNHMSQSYKAEIRKGFKIVLDKLNIR